MSMFANENGDFFVRGFTHYIACWIFPVRYVTVYQRVVQFIGLHYGCPIFHWSHGPASGPRHDSLTWEFSYILTPKLGMTIPTDSAASGAQYGGIRHT